MKKTECIWKLDGWEWSLWGSSCGLLWQIDNDASPKENNMNYCPKCGLLLKVEEKEGGKVECRK